MIQYILHIYISETAPSNSRLQSGLISVQSSRYFVYNSMMNILINRMTGACVNRKFKFIMHIQCKNMVMCHCTMHCCVLWAIIRVTTIQVTRYVQYWSVKFKRPPNSWCVIKHRQRGRAGGEKQQRRVLTLTNKKFTKPTNKCYVRERKIQSPSLDRLHLEI